MKPNRPAWHHDRRSRHERGYGGAWDKLRLVILKRDGYRCRCEDCARTGALVAATQVDHIVSKAEWLRLYGSLSGVDDPSNLRAMSKAHHERKTITEKGHRPAARIGLDGFPIEEG